MLRRKTEILTRYDVARIARHIENSATATSEILRDLSTAPLQESGRLELRVRSVELSTAIHMIVQSFTALPGGDRITFDVEPGLCTRADLPRLDQMIGNLLLNALQHVHDGPIVVRAGAASPTEVWIEVSDQVSAEGLAAVRGLAELHGGRVELRGGAQSRSGTFRIILPRAN